MSFLRLPHQRALWAANSAHFTNDVFMSIGPVLLAYLALGRVAMSPAQLGALVAAQQLTGALSQPFFGYAADRGPARLLGVGGVAWTVVMLSLAVGLAAATGSFWALAVPFVLAAFGSGAFHPAGASLASTAQPERANTNTATFFLVGQVGLACGPLLAGLLLELLPADARWGATPLFALSLAALPVLAFTGMQFPARGKRKPAPGDDFALVHNGGGVLWAGILALGVMVVLRGAASPGSAAYLPTLFQAKGWGPQAYGALTSAYWMASAVGTFVFGLLADRVGQRRVIAVGLVLAAPAFWLLPEANGAAAFALAVATGALAGGSHGLIVVLAQRLIPFGRGLASGLALGSIFAAGALGTLLIGVLAEGRGPFVGLGLSGAFQTIGLLAVAAGGVTMFLPGARKAAPTATRAPATEAAD